MRFDRLAGVTFRPNTREVLHKGLPLLRNSGFAFNVAFIRDCCSTAGIHCELVRERNCWRPRRFRYDKMAYSEEADEDFKLPLRPWLEKQINSGKFTGLEWDQYGENSKQFRLPWVKKNLPNWENYYQIFRAWAEHRGQGKEDDDSKLKSRFRCALNKSADFEEMTSKSQLHKQTGNYKVYRILTPKEVRERKKSKNKIHAKQEPSFDYNFNTDDIKTVDKKSLEFLDNMNHSSPSESLDISITELPSSMQTCEPSNMTVDASTFLIQDEIVTCPQFVVPPPPDADDLGNILAISPVDNTITQQQWQNDVVMDDVSTAQSPPLKKEFDDINPLLLLLQQLGVKSEQLGECRLIIRYDGEKVYDNNVSNMERGYRIFYGDPKDQIRLLQMRNTTDEKMSDYYLPEIRLPSLKQQSQTMSAILDKTELGITVCYDPLTLSFKAKRLCQSQVFRFDPIDRSPVSSSPIKMKREETVCLFQHGEYVTEYLERFVNSDTLPAPPEAEIMMAVGIKPKSRQSMRKMKGLKIEIIPHAVAFFLQSYKEANSSLSLCFSNPTSMENLLRQINKNSLVRNHPMYQMREIDNSRNAVN